MAIGNGALAQLGEHLLCKQGVVGSIPTSSTIPLNGQMAADGISRKKAKLCGQTHRGRVRLF